MSAIRAGGGHGHRGGVDDGDTAGVSGTGDREADFSGPADGVGDEVATRLHSRVLVRLDGSVVTLILYRPGPLYVVPPRTPPWAHLRTPKREEPDNLTAMTHISDTVLVAIVTGTLTLFAGIYSELIKDLISRRHKREAARQEAKSAQLSAVREFLAITSEARLKGLENSIPLAVSTTKIPVNPPKGIRHVLGFASSSKIDYAPDKVAEDKFRLSVSSALLRAEIHKAWVNMDLQLIDPHVRAASEKVRTILMDNTEYVGPPITNPYTKNRTRSTLAVSNFDLALDNLRKTATDSLI